MFKHLYFYEYISDNEMNGAPKKSQRFVVDNSDEYQHMEFKRLPMWK
jgi:hypothetical protein